MDLIFPVKRCLFVFGMLLSIPISFCDIGNILGLVLTYLADNMQIYLGSPNKLIYAQIGVVLETICFTAGLGYLFLAEMLNFYQAIGGATILAGSFLISKLKIRQTNF